MLRGSRRKLAVNMHAATKEKIAIGICAASVLVAVAAIRAKLNLPNTIMCVGVVLDRVPPPSGAILEAVLYRGEVQRSDAASLFGTGDRQARRVVSALIDSLFRQPGYSLDARVVPRARRLEDWARDNIDGDAPSSHPDLAPPRFKRS
jgi:hypothetical protein